MVNDMDDIAAMILLSVISLENPTVTTCNDFYEDTDRCWYRIYCTPIVCNENLQCWTRMIP